MEKGWILLIVILVFLVFIYLYWRLTHSYVKRENGEKMWKRWSMKLYYWEAGVLYSSGATVLTISLLKWSNILVF